MKSLRRLVWCALGATLVLAQPAAANEAATAFNVTPERAGFHKSGALSKADTALAAIHAEFTAYTSKGTPTAFKPSSNFVQTSGGSILVDVRAVSDGEALLNDLVQLGMTRASRYGDIVSGLLPFSAIDDAVALSSLRAITASPKPIAHAGSIQSQGDAAIAGDVARALYGIDGSGVTVGVISDAYNSLGGAAADIASGDLPPGGVPVLNGESTLCGTFIFCVDEGRAMLQIIHDVAPGADLLFQSGIDGVAAYANAIANLRANGADIIVDDLLIINEPMFQDGPIAQAVDAVVAEGAAYFTAAGNSGRQSYEAPFDDSGEIFCIEFFEPIGDCDPIFERVGSMHDFDPGPGVDNYLNITVPVNGVMTVAMQWDQPYGGAGPTTDHDIVLLDGTGQQYITIGANDNIVTGEGWEALQLDNNEVLDYGTEFSIMITYDDVDSVGPPATLVKFVIFGEGITIQEHATNSGALFGHPNASGAEAVGAAFYMDTPANGTSPPLLRSFSSAGGTPILFDDAGVALPGPEVRQAPEIVAADGVNTTFFFDDSIGNDGIDDFTGTSAAAPHAAGVAALLLEARHGATPDQLYSALENSAIDMGTPGVDFDSGHGLIQADAAIAELLASAPLPFQRIATLDNIGGSAAPDIGVTLSGSLNGYAVDASTDQMLGAQTFNASRTPIDMGVVDVDGTAAIAVLCRDATGRAWVEVRDAVTGNLVRDVWFSSGYAPIALTVLPDLDGNNISEVAVLMKSHADGRAWVHIKDASTLAYVNNVWFEGGYTPLDLEYVPNVDGNPGGELAVLMSRDIDDRAWVHVKDAQTGAYVKNVWFEGGFTPVDLAVIDNLDANPGSELAVLFVRDSDSRSWVHIKDAATGAYVKNVWFSEGFSPAGLATVPDLDANPGDELAVLMTRDADGRAWVHVKDALTGAAIRDVWFQADFVPSDFAVLPEVDANPGSELAVLGVKSGGLVQTEIKDTLTGAYINHVNFP